MFEGVNAPGAPLGRPGFEALPPAAAQHQLALRGTPAATNVVQSASEAIQKRTQHRPGALQRYQHYAATLGRELAVLLLCHGTTALAAAVRLSCRLAHVLGIQLRDWLGSSQAPKAAAAVLVQALLHLRALLQRRVAQPLGRLLTQLLWVQVQLSADEVLDEGTRVSARLNSCVSLLFGSIRLRSHSCLQLAAPCRQPVLAPEFSLTSPAPSPRHLTATAAAQTQQQQQLRQQPLLRSSSSPSPHGSPRRAAAAAGAAGISRRRSTAASAGSSPQGSSLGMAALSGSEQQQQQQQDGSRASAARALRFSQHPRQGLAASVGAETEVHVLCSTDLKRAILAFLQAHSKHNGSEFVLLSNFGTNTPPTPTPEGNSPTAGAAAAAAVGVSNEPYSAEDAAFEQQQQQQQPEEQAMCSKGASDEGQAHSTGVIRAVADDGSSGGSSKCDSSADGTWVRGSFREGVSSPQQQPQQQQQQQQDGPLPVLCDCLHQQQQQQQQQQYQQLLGFRHKAWDQPRGSLTLAEAWEQLHSEHHNRKHRQQQQQQDADVAPARSCDTQCHNISSNGSSMLANAANLLAAAAEALGDQHMADSPPKCDTSSQRAMAAAAARVAVAAAAAGADEAGSNASSRQNTTQDSSSFVSAADKFRSLAASAAAAQNDSDLCSKPLMAFSRKQSSSPPVGMRRSGSNRALHTATSLQQQQYALLFPPGSRSFEALSLRKSGGKSPIGTPACHARNAVTFTKKKLPAAPFSPSSVALFSPTSVALSLDGTPL